MAMTAKTTHSGQSRLPRRKIAWAIALLLASCGFTTASLAGSYQETPAESAEETQLEETSSTGLTDLLDHQQWTEPERLSGTVKTVLLISIISLAPAILMMTTSFVRIVVVLGILRHAIGAQQLPSAQIITALALFMTFLIMTPVWKEVKTQAIDPYTSGQEGFTAEMAWERGTIPVKRFMCRQIDVSRNVNDIWLFYQYLPESERQTRPEKYEDIPLEVLLPAFLISELKIAFFIGFQIFMPFLVIDLVVASVSTSMGMFMLPPAMVSLPLKLMLFVLADGWNLIVGMLMQSFAPYT